MFLNSTIVAISTAAGTGAIGLVRLCGPKSIDIVNTLFAAKSGKDLDAQKSHTVHFGNIFDTSKDKADKSVIDEVLVSVFKEGRSYTGENTVEIAAHGSPYILNQIVEACLNHGARLAAPGEFTQRAFLNGRMDLAQAEAVGDLIAAENKAGHDIALNQMRGGISSELADLREQLINFTALMELELDFSDEDVEFADRTQLENLIAILMTRIQVLIKSFEYGNAIKNGVPVAIIGKPNAGKSTLLNALLKEERAIVSEIAGTTRDVIEETINIEGITFRFIDTAGIRDTSDTIEAIGVARAKEKVQQAKVVIHLYEDNTEVLDDLASELGDKLVFNLKSKQDLHQATVNSQFDEIDATILNFGISVKTGHNLDRLQNALVEHFKKEASASSVIITNVRHKQALEKAQTALEEVKVGMKLGLTGDLLSLHLKDALLHLGAITGKIEIDRDILGAVFGKFCIGK